jgi:DNA-binding IscR family transcriptional regulator
MARDEAIPKKFLEQILLSLKVTTSSRARKEGRRLFSRAAPHEITIGSVIRLIEGPLAPLPCASETRFRKCDECPDAETCGTRIVMREVRDAIAAILDRTTLAMVCEKVDSARDKHADPTGLMYYI